MFDRHGNRVGRRMRQNDRLLMFLLRAYMPDRFGNAHRDARVTQAPPPEPPIGEALRRLEPAPPPAPHTLMPPDELDAAIQCADILDGALPHWHRYEVEEPHDSPLGEAFERKLEAAKREAAGLPPEGEADDGHDDRSSLG